MKCPHCEHEHVPEYWDEVNNKWNADFAHTDPFYKMPVKLEQRCDYYIHEAYLYGCPACKKTFIKEALG